MPTPIQSKTPLARIEPAKQELPSLEQMRTDLLSIEADEKLPTMFRLLAGSQRTIVDHLRLMVTGQRMMAQSFKKYVEDNNKALVAEINAVLAGATAGEPQPEAEQESAPESAQPAAVAEIVPPTPPIVTPPPTPSPNAPQMTITPVVRTGQARRSTAAKANNAGGAK